MPASRSTTKGTTGCSSSGGCNHDPILRFDILLVIHLLLGRKLVGATFQVYKRYAELSGNHTLCNFRQLHDRECTVNSFNDDQGATMTTDSNKNSWRCVLKGQWPVCGKPWDEKWWKPKNPRRDLVKAGALILAEIERIDRQSEAANCND